MWCELKKVHGRFFCVCGPSSFQWSQLAPPICQTLNPLFVSPKSLCGGGSLQVELQRESGVLDAQGVVQHLELGKDNQSNV